MRIIISPAKQMRVDTDTFASRELPVFLDQAEILAAWISSLSYNEQKKLWACSDKIALQSAEQFAQMDLRKNLTPAILSFDGIQYTYMAPAVFEDGQYDYVEKHLRILSGFYGVLKPMDGVVPYRLEMQAKIGSAAGQSGVHKEGAGSAANPAGADAYKDLYAFWGNLLYREVMDESRTILNLASKEYSKCIEKHLKPGDRFITCFFGEPEGNRIIQKGVYAKMARGEMVRYLAGICAKDPEEAKGFSMDGYAFDEARSSASEYVFVRNLRG